MEAANNEVKQYHLHLVSDATGDTLETMVKAALVQFEDSAVKKHYWPMIRTARQMERILDDIKDAPGLIMYTLVNEEIRETLIAGCKKMGVPMLSVLDPVIDSLADYLDQEARRQPGRQYMLNAEYFERMDALQFTMTHDDGQLPADISGADIILVGVSRTSKTPTSIYMANRGHRVANVPYVLDIPMPEALDNVGDTFVVGLTVSPERLVQIRTNRLRSINEDTDTDYVDPERVNNEIAACRRYCTDHGWPIIDVTRRSIEETAAGIINLFQKPEDR